MKITQQSQSAQPFDPITIVLETREEAAELAGILRSRSVCPDDNVLDELFCRLIRMGVNSTPAYLALRKRIGID